MSLRRVFQAFQGSKARIAELLSPVRYKTHFSTQEINPSSPWVFRGDYRSFAELKNEGGLKPGNKNLLLSHHVVKKSKRNPDGSLCVPYCYEDSGYVSVSLDHKTAVDFAKKTNAQGNRVIYKILMPAIRVERFHMQDFGPNFFPSVSQREAEVSSTDLIPFEEIAAYQKFKDYYSSWQETTCYSYEINQTWHQNSAYSDDLKRDASITVLSKSDKEAACLKKSFPDYIYPSYETAIIAAAALKEETAKYKVAEYVMCFGGLQVRMIEEMLERPAGSGFSETELPNYYLRHYQFIQKTLNRPKRCATFFTPENLLTNENTNINTEIPLEKKLFKS